MKQISRTEEGSWFVDRSSWTSIAVDGLLRVCSRLQDGRPGCRSGWPGEAGSAARDEYCMTMSVCERRGRFVRRLRGLSIAAPAATQPWSMRRFV